MKTEIQLPKTIASVLMQNMINKHKLWQHISPNDNSVINSLEEDGKVTSVKFKNIGNKTITLHHDGLLEVVEDVPDISLCDKVTSLMNPLHCSLTEITDLSLANSSLPLGSIPVMPVRNQHNQHVFSKYADRLLQEYCGVEIDTSPFTFGALIDLNRDTVNDELMKTGYFSGKDTFTGTYHFTHFYLQDLVKGEQIALTCTNRLPGDVFSLNNKTGRRMFTLTYDAGDDNVSYLSERTFNLPVNNYTVSLNIAADGTLDLDGSQMFVDGEVEVVDVWNKEGTSINIHGAEWDEVVSYFYGNFKLIGYAIDLQRNCNYREPTIVEEQQFWTTPLVPIKTETNLAMFSVSALPDMIMINGELITVPPFAFNKSFDLLSLTSSEELLEHGYIDIEDSVKPDVKISSIFLSTSIGVIELKRDTPELSTVSIKNYVSNKFETSSDELFTGILFVKDVVKKSRFDCNDYETTKVAISFKINFKALNELGSISTTLSNVSIDSLLDINGNRLPFNESEKQVFYEKISFAGFYISGCRINYKKPIS